MAERDTPDLAGSIAIVGMAGRFPGARDLGELWRLLAEGREAIRRLTPAEAAALGVAAADLDDPAFVPAVAMPEDIDRFDAPFFGFNPREAEVLDPQQRLLLEVAWQALEDAGYDPLAVPGLAGVFAGATTSTYLLFHLLPNEALRRAVDPLTLLVGNAGDSLATRLSYKLNLKGPSYTIASACSTSLVALHNACQSLNAEECDLALVGGVSINLSARAGYRYTRDSILAPDGHCRAFSAGAAGTVFGSGIGVVVLKRAEDALADGDSIRALILGSAINNDGGEKVGYTAPAVQGQAEVITEALAAAGISARDLSYLEAHGTGTHLGDPIEIQAIRRAFAPDTEEKGFCRLGSIKTNLGHLDIAAGIAGLIKTVLALEQRQIPPSLHFDAPHPEIDFATSPVRVVTALEPWEANGAPRRAGVSSFGFGGTNAHVVLEEAPAPLPTSPARTWQVLPLSAKTETALAAGAARLAEHLRAHPDLSLADAAFTLQTGRHAFPLRRAVVARSLTEAAELLAAGEPLGMPAAAEGSDEAALARRFVAGKAVEWTTLRGRDERRRRLPLPAYTFDPHRYWIEAPAAVAAEPVTSAAEVPAASGELHPRPALATPFVAPRSPDEERLAALWRELLGLAQVGVDDDFFELGGHSLLGTRLLARVRRDLGADLPLDALFAAPTVAGLAARLPAAPRAVAAIPRRADPRTPPPPSFSQQRLWFIDRLEPGNPIYNEARAVRLAGRLPPRGVAALAASLTAIVERHEVLRTTFADRGGEPVLAVVDGVRVRVPVVDVAGVHPQAGLSSRFARLPFDLSRAPLLRACLVRLGPELHDALFAIHHIASDGWSMGVLVAEVGALYGWFLEEGRHRGRPLPALPIQYGDVAAWQRAEMAGERLGAEVAAWNAHLAGAPAALDLPLDHPRPAVLSPAGATLPVHLSAELTGRLTALARARGATLFGALAAGFAALLGRLTGQGELLLGTPVANRRFPELEGLIGFFVNTLVLRARPGRVNDGTTFDELLEGVAASALFAHAHQDLPFDKLVEELGVERDLSRPPLVQVLFGLHNVPAGALTLPGLTATPRPLAAGTAKFELTLSLTETAAGLEGEAEFASALFDTTTIRRWLAAYKRLLRHAAEAPAAPLAAAPWLSPAEAQQLAEWNDTARPYRRGVLLDELILEQAARTPDALALTFEDEWLSYAALADESAALAEGLLSRGVGPGKVAGVRAERCLELPVHLLAVLRAGGAYLPLDPELPAARREGMVADAGVVEVIGPHPVPLPRAGEGAPALPSEPLSRWRERGRGEGGLRRGEGLSGKGLRTDADPAYVIFTSGSTGRPKGAVNAHAGIVNRLLWMQEQYGLGPDDRVLQKTPASFDVSVWEFFWPLLTGARLVLARPGGHRDPSYLALTIAEQRITTLHFVPAMLQTFLDEEDLSGTDSVRRVIASGEALPAELAARFSERFAAPLWNLYGPTEAAVDVTFHRAPRSGEGAVPIGRAVANTSVAVLDAALRPCPLGVPGELFLGGIQVGGGYLGRPALTAERFLPAAGGGRLYKTGDRARFQRDGTLEFLGRLDFQVKIRGVRIELGEIEAALLAHPEVREARVVVRGEGARLIAYYVAAGPVPAVGAAARERPAQGRPLRDFLAQRLPEAMLPAAFVELEAFPLNPNGKVDLKALPEPAAPSRTGVVLPAGRVEAAVAAVWAEVLGLPAVGVNESFFALGGHSLLLPRVLARLREELPGERSRALTLVDLFRHATVASLAKALAPHGEEPAALLRGRERAGARRRALSTTDVRIAVIGLAGRFPGAASPASLWQELRAGREGIHFWTEEELRARGLPEALLADPRFVRASALPDGYDLFDAPFFGLAAREAEILDPQQRLLLELAWEALEDAGYEPAAVSEATAVFAGAATSSYLLYNLVPNALAGRGGLDPLALLFGNQGDAAATRISYTLDLKGPSHTLLSACSTSLLTVHEACQSLLTGGCRMALAGGSSLPVGHLYGYRYEEGSIASPDGHCRAFDAAAGGTVFGGGGGLVVLKRLSDALADGDTVRAVILGTAANNDGAAKVGYTAPSVEGQAAVVAEALAFAGVPASSLAYIEAHGTGTRLGDPIEVQALTDVFRAETDRAQIAALGSIKSNLGHLDTAAGIAGLTKVVLALEHGEIPPSLHVAAPNPEIDFERGPLFVARELLPWQRSTTPRRAGVSSFGIGGTNLHAVLEEAPVQEPGAPHRRPLQLVPVSARSGAALAAARERLAAHLEAHPELELADVAFTLSTGRRSFGHRQVALAGSRGELLATLRGEAPEGLLGSGEALPQRAPRVAFLFSGQGSQHPGMGRGLYASEPVFKAEIDRAARQLAGALPLDLCALLFPEVEDEAASALLTRTELAQPALFAFEHALARLWQSLGVEPAALLGHSIGEYAAACLAGVMRFEDALALVALRGRLMAELPAGGMLAASLSESETLDRLSRRPELALAAVNEPGRVVVSGPHTALEAFEEELFEAGIACRSLHTSHAFHSPMMEPILGRFEQAVAAVLLQPPRLPFLSNLTGTWITPEQATSPAYWAAHLRGAVRFADGVARLAEEGAHALLEVGPGNALATLARAQLPGSRVIASCRHAREGKGDLEVLLGAFARLWLAGAAVPLGRLYDGERRRRVPLPTYPFERRRYWIDPPAGALGLTAAPAAEAPALLPVSLGASAGLHPRPPVATAFEAPRGATEETLAGLWQELLGVGPIGRRDSFFELGGHSLLGTQLVARLRERQGFELPLAALFEAPTIAALAPRLDAAARAPHAAAELGRELPGAVLSFAEERLWFLARLEPESSAYHLPFALRFVGELSLALCRRAFAEVCRRHETLRTTFGEQEGTPVVRIAPALPPAFAVIDLSRLGAAPRGREAERLLAAEALGLFDLTRGPLLRVRFLRLTASEHWALVTLHHIIADGWSMGVLVEELTTLYRAFALGQGSPLPELPITLREVAARERRTLAGERLAAHIAFWREALAGAPALLELPTDHPRPAVASYDAGLAPFRFSPPLTRRLAAFGESEGASLFMVVLAGFQAFLSRLAGQHDVLVGSPIAGRDRLETEGLIGLFVNTLVLRARIEEQEPGRPPGLRQLLAEVRETALAAFAHGELPFEKLVDELKVERSLTHNPIFQVMLSFQNAPAGTLELPGLALTPIQTQAAAAKFDLQLTLWEEGQGLEGNLEFKRALFDPTTIVRWGRQLLTFLEAALAAPNAPLATVPLLSAPERQQLAEWNDTARPYRRGVLLDGLILEQVERTPEAMALGFEDEWLSYAGLAAESARLAGELAARGVGPGRVVGVMAERSLKLPVHLLAVLRAGGAYLPLDPELPAARREGMVADAGVVQVIGPQPRGPHPCPSPAGGRGVLREGRGRPLPLAGEGRGEGLSAEGFRTDSDPAYIIFTSGSTGRPKGAANAHSGIVNRLLWMQEQYGLGPGDRVLQKTPASFDVSVWEFFWPLLTGACLVLAKPGGHRDSGYLATTIAERRITTLHFVPSMLQAFLEEKDLTGLGAVRRVIASGEALPAELAARFAERFVAPLWNLYGPTEAAVDVTYHPAPRRGEGAVSIGRPVANTAVTVLDRAFEPCPLGVPGELYLGGIQVGGGYLGRPALTADRFRPDGLTGATGARLYKTGDRVRWQQDGTLDFLGRLDFQVKIRGLRIELGEIEAALLTHPEVREARVVARGEGAETRLVAYYVGRGAGTEPEKRPAQGRPLRDFLAQHLPEYMVPSAFVELEAFPLNPNGKVDLKALPEPEAARALFEPPRLGLESELAAIWRELLRVEVIGRNDSFFALGGHSLMATRLLVRLRARFDVDLPLRQVFSAPTLAAFAAAVEAARRGSATEAAPPSGPGATPLAMAIPHRAAGAVPLSFAQERLWFLEQLTPGLTAYTIPWGLELRGRLDLAVLHRAFREIGRRHATLRTTFEEGEEGPRQVIAAPFRVPLSLVDLQALPEATRVSTQHELAARLLQQPFDLTRGPLLRIRLLRLSKERWAALFAMHHIISDGWSMGILVAELTTLYRAFARAAPSPLPELPIGFADFAAWQRDWLRGGELERQLTFWRGELAGAPALLELPTDRPRAARAAYDGGSFPLRISAQLRAKLSAFAEAEGASLFMVLLAAFTALLARLTGQRDVLVGTPVAGREHLETENLIGFFVNTLPLRLRLGEAGERQSARVLLHQVREATLAFFAHQELPFERLVEELRLPRSLAHNPIFQVMLALQNAPAASLDLPELAATAFDLPARAARLDLLLQLFDDGPQLTGDFEYRRALFDATTIERWAGYLCRLLEGFATDPEAAWETLPLLSAAERQQLAEWNDTARPYRRGVSLDGLILEQAERTPEAMALSFEEEWLSYAALDEESAGLARDLATRGVGPGKVVAVHAERSLELPVHLLAVLRSGGAYLPLDPELPAARRESMVADAGVVEVIGPHPALPSEPLSRLRERGRGEGLSAEGLRTDSDPAYIIFTSGSTGRPKGAINAHAGIVNRLLWMQEQYGLGPGDRVLQKTPASFDVSVWEFFWPLSTGACLVLARPGSHRDSGDLTRAVSERRITALHFVPSMLHAFLEEQDLSGCDAVRCVIASGEALPAELAARFAERLAAPLWNLYGPTEAAVDVTYHLAPRTGRGTVPIGRPVANTSVAVLDRALEPCPLGVPGELYLGGIQVGGGYLGRPALTADRFRPDGLTGASGARLYKTGDRVRWQQDGTLDFLGRLDFQVKIRGLRIELGEIEAALLTHPEVHAARVVARGEGAEKRLVAYYVGRGAGTAPEKRPAQGRPLRDFLAQHLPEYMVPQAFVELEAFPLNPNGKVDLTALPEPEAARALFEPPRPGLESELAAIWRELLGVETIGRRDDFFALGGHSLLATRLATRLRTRWGVALPVVRIFSASTLAALAAELAPEVREVGGGPFIPRRRENDPLLLTFAEERLFFLDHLRPGGSEYNLPAAYALAGRLDTKALAGAFADLVNRHEALRTTFVEVGGEGQRVITPPGQRGSFAFHAVDLTDLPADAGKELARTLARAEAGRPFDLGRGPLLRLLLLPLAREAATARADLVVNQHHIISDGWSLGLMTAELAALYLGRSTGRPSPLPELPIQMADYAAWQRRTLDAGALAAQVAAWREELAGAPALLDLPTDRPRPSQLDATGFGRPFHLPAAALARLEALAREEGATLFMLVLAAFQLVLARWSGQRDVSIGAPVANRGVAELEGLLGFFVNTLVFRGRLDGNPTFREHLRRTRDRAFAAYALADLPFDRLVEELAPERRPATTPLFQVSMTLQNLPQTTPEVDGLTLTRLELATSTAKFDLTLGLIATEGVLWGNLEARSSLFDTTTIDRLLAAFGALLEAIGHTPERRLGELPLAPASLRQQLLREWNDTAALYPADSLVHRLYERRAAAAPEAIAITWGAEHLSAGELNRRANQSARRLLALGVGWNGPGEPVALCLERSPELVVTLLAILKAGGAYVPLDLAYPPERLAILLEDSGARVLVATAELAARFPEWSAQPGHRLLRLDEEAAALAALPDSDLPAAGDATADTLAYLIYTSGSTGRPKGVAVPHRPIVRLVWNSDYCRLTEGDRVAQASNTSFDAATFEIWGPLLTGGTIVGLERETSLSPRALAAALADEAVTTLFLTTALFNQVAREAPAGFGGLTHLLFGGEAVDPAWVEAVLREGPPERLLHVYGPTESTTYSTWARLRTVPPGALTLPIGGPLGNTTQFILDAWGAPVLPGAAGELALGGDGLAWGYWARPAATAERFVPDPWGAPGARLYRTGDRVRLLPGGLVEFLGRADAQVKIRGFRIELPEIEATLARHPAVGEAVVLVREETPGDKELVAYVEPRGGAFPTVAELKGHLAASLPAFMVPAGFVLLPELPLNPNGKVDRKALAALAPSIERQVLTFRPPQTVTEDLLAGIWADLLGSGSVGLDDNFFALGGHSLLAIRLASRLRETFGVELPLRSLFESETLEELALAVEAARFGSAALLPPVLPRPRGARIPLSFAQERLWFLDQLEPGAATYNVLAAVRLRGRLDAAALARALTTLTARHEALRTVFTAEGGVPSQRVLAPHPVPLPLVDLGGLAGGAQKTLRVLVRAESGRGFDLARGPLFRTLLLRLGEGEHAALLNLHHIVADGWSIDLLIAELTALYAGRTLPELAVQVADAALWQRQHLEGERLAAELAFWRRTLAGAPALLPLPADRPRPSVMGFRGGTVAVRLGAAERDALLALGRRHGATLFMTLFGAFAALLARLSGQREVVVGSPIANRPRPELEGLIGLFVNNLALRADLAGGPGFASLLARLRPAVLDAFAHGELPFERLVDELGVPRSLAHHPVYQVVFSLLERPRAALELPGLTLEPLAFDDGTAKLDLQLTWSDGAGGLAGALQFNTDLFDATTVARWAGHLRRLIAAVLEDADAPLDGLDLATPAERAQLATEWNDTRRLGPPAPRLDELLAARVDERGDAVALAAGEERLSYGALLARADALAARLAERGAGPEALVALSLPRGIDFAVAVVATFRAGAAYLPLDPTHPAERLALMLADSAAGLVVTEGGHVAAGLLPAGLLPAVDAAAEQRPARGRPLPGGAANLAYVIYTSGSTGRPNGVLVPHAAASTLIRSAVEHFGVGPGSRVLQIVSTSFDASVLETWMSFAAGACLVIPDEETRRAPAALTEFLERHAITTAVLTPAVAALLDPDALPALQAVSVGGESCPAEVATAWAGGRGRRLLNCYGPTEAAIYAAVHPCRGTFRREPPLGRPVPEARLHLLDRGGRSALPGAAGELAIGGAGLARGYLGRPGLTALRFRPDPFAALSGEPGARLYHTGDRARHAADGRLEFLGRLDAQVKIRGLRIELGEIEATCAAHPAVREAVVTSFTNTRGETALAAYLVPRPGEEASALPARLRAELGARLPEYMIPATFVLLPALPLTPTGKLDRRALPPPELEEAEVAAPRDALELTLARLFAEVLERPAVGIHGDFFALGGHSLLAVRLLARIRQELALELPLSTLFTAGTAAGLAALVRRGGAPALGSLVALRAGSGQALFLVHPAGGDVLCYAPLAAHLGERPVYGLKARGLEAGEGAPLTSIEELAAAYLTEVRRAQPTGPYAFAGWSLGGLVAFEMARQATAAGDEVGLLAVIDTTAGMGGEAGPPGEVDLLLDVAAYVENLWGRRVDVSREELEALPPETRLTAFVARLEAAGFLPEGAGPDTIRRLLTVYETNLAAARRYRVRPFAGELLLLPARDRTFADPAQAPELLTDPTLGWSHAAERVTVRPVAGNHLTLVAEPQVVSLATELAEALAGVGVRGLGVG